jgi:N-acetylglucosaminyl-diphospho-decaprenol L-rhamnosyltransferase
LTPEPEIPERQAPRISVVIVTFNRVEQVRASLEALGVEHQIVIVDNGSSDGTEALGGEFPHVRFSRLPKNFGLVKALNIGLRSAEGEYILWLHDDARISGAGVTRLAEFLESRADVGAVCPLLTDEDGAALAQIRALPAPGDPDPALRVPENGPGEIAVECVSGGAFMFRAFFLRALRHIDERYGTWGASSELCIQMRRAAKKIIILRDVTAIHERARSPMPSNALDGDRAAGTAAFLGKHYGLLSALVYRLKTGLAAVVTFRFAVAAGAISGQKIDGTG